MNTIKMIKKLAAVAIAAVTFGFAPSAEAQEAVEYRVPVYNTSWDPADGIAYWETRSVSEYVDVRDVAPEEGGLRNWGKANETTWYVVSGDVTYDDMVVCNGDVNLILTDGCTLTVTSGGRAGVCVNIDGSDTNTLTIYGQSEGTGTLNATGGKAGAGIGSRNEQYHSGPITINGGVVTARGGARDSGELYAAGIGGGCTKDGDHITINGGTVTAIGGGKKGAGIGGGKNGAGRNITINGGTVEATGGNYASGIGGGDTGNGENIWINGGTVKAYTSSWGAALGGGGGGGVGKNIWINGGTVFASATYSTAIGSGSNVKTADGIYVSQALLVKADNNNSPATEIKNAGGDLTDALRSKHYATIEPKPTMVEVVPSPVEHATAQVFTAGGEIVKAPPFMVAVNTMVTVVYTAEDGYAFEGGVSSCETAAFMADADPMWMPVASPAQPAEVTTGVEYLSPVYVDGNVTRGIDGWVACMVDSYTTVTDQTTWGSEHRTTWYVVEGDVTIAGRIACVGDVRLILKDGAKLTASTGVTVTGDANALTVYAQSEGTGTLEATGGSTGSGIGGLAQSGFAVGQNITINGGVITATGSGSGIGGSGNTVGGVGQDIVINGGTVTATCVNSYGAGIGGGGGCDGHDITVNGGTVEATGHCGAGIGGGGNGVGADITINGGTVTAIGGGGNGGGAGIGGGDGNNGQGRNITINGGTVTATGGYSNASASGIGNGGRATAYPVDIYISTSLITMADEDTDLPETLIWNDGNDLAEELKGLRSVKIFSNEEEPAVEELVLWEGEAVVDDWNDPVTGSQPALITGGGAVLQNAGAYVGQEIRFYITPTGDYNADGYENWWCDIVEGNWNGVYVQRCAPGCYNEDDPNRMEWDLDANGGYISFTLTQEMLDAAYRKGEGTGVFVANGNDAIITKIALVDPKAPVTPVEPEEEHPAIDPDLSVYPYYWDDGMVLWEGEVLADGWKNGPYFFVNNAVEVMDAEGVSAKEGDEIRFYITPTEWSWACEIWKGDWSGIYVSYNSDEWDLEANGGYISLTLTQEMLEFAYTKESWSGLFIANADNVVVTKIVHVRNGEGGGESGGGDIGGGTTPEEPEVKDYPAYIPDDEGVKAKYDAWVEAFCISDRIDADAALQNAYLLNVAPADAERAMAEFRITSITVNADGTVTITTPEGKNYNGTVEIIGAETLDGDYTAAKVWYNTARFFKAILK